MNQETLVRKAGETALGAILGAALGFGLSFLRVLPNMLFFPGDWTIAGAILGAICGFIWGDEFFAWIVRNWHWLP